MSLENTIHNATCRVDKGGNQIGSAFWISEQKLATAAHVVETFQESEVTIRTHTGKLINCSIECIYGSESDLAVLKAEDQPDDCETLNLSTDIPPVGSEVVWSGYARLFGEPKIDRQRFGWGRIASEKYGKGEAEFFEVDGLFNPSHSGGPVISRESEQVVGVVSASAGAFDNLEEAWETRTHLLTEMLNLYKEVTGESGFTHGIEIYDPEVAAQVQTMFDQAGIDFDAEVEDGNVHITFFREEIPGSIGVILSQMSQLLLDTARNTFQMGVGIATGGKPLGKQR